jgi:hypothetical protein
MPRCSTADLAISRLRDGLTTFFQVPQRRSNIKRCLDDALAQAVPPLLDEHLSVVSYDMTTILSSVKMV